MALRSTASVATAVKRRGAGTLDVSDFIWLQENSKEVKKVSVLLDKHAESARDAEKKADEAKVTATLRLEQAAVCETVLNNRTVDLDKSAAEAARKLEADLEMLGRRTEAVVTKERTSDEREEALGRREGQISARERDRETEIQAREDVVETRETAADERDRTQQELAADLTKRATTIKTASTMLKQAAASLR